VISLFDVHMNLNQALSKLNGTLQSGYVGEGPRVVEFEEKLSAMWQLGYDRRVVAVNSCTSALDMALTMAENDRPKGNVVSTPMTCLATNVNLLRHGHEIRWADVDPLTGLITLQSVKDLVDKDTIAVISVQWGGRPVDPAIAEFLTHTDHTYSIEDAAHGVLTPSNADFVCYSFQAIKHLTCGDGGALVVPRWFEADAKKLRWYGLDRTTSVNFRSDQNVEELGFKYNMNDIAASIGLANIQDVHWVVSTARAHAHYYDAAFSSLEDVEIIPYDPQCSYWMYTLHVKNRPHFIAYMANHGIEASQVHSRNDLMSAFFNNPLVNDATNWEALPGVDHFNHTQVAIPVRASLTAAQSAHIAKTVREYRHSWA
jgi:dTDP-4-amino-4,6-dideoxygalactose transaminase